MYTYRIPNTDIIWIVIIHIIESRGKIFIIEGIAVVVVAQVYRNGFPKTMVIIIYNTTVFDYIIYLVDNNLFFNFSFYSIGQFPTTKINRYVILLTERAPLYFIFLNSFHHIFYRKKKQDF